MNYSGVPASKNVHFSEVCCCISYWCDHLSTADVKLHCYFLREDILFCSAKLLLWSPRTDQWDQTQSHKSRAGNKNTFFYFYFFYQCDQLKRPKTKNIQKLMTKEILVGHPERTKERQPPVQARMGPSEQGSPLYPDMRPWNASSF